MDPIISSTDVTKCSSDCPFHQKAAAIFPVEFNGTDQAGIRFGHCEKFNEYIKLDETSFKPKAKVTFFRCEECKKSY